MFLVDGIAQTLFLLSRRVKEAHHVLNTRVDKRLREGTLERRLPNNTRGEREGILFKIKAMITKGAER